MPLVFVHGINVRKDATYDVNQNARDALFRKYALLSAITEKPLSTRIENPYWGQYGADPAWQMASLPDGQYQAFGQTDTIYEQILTENAWDIEVSEPDKILLAIAQAPGEPRVIKAEPFNDFTVRFAPCAPAVSPSFVTARISR